jgi:hypothetical protein
MLPWRRVLEGEESVLALAGGAESLWVVRPDGLILEWRLTSCPPPWSADHPDDPDHLKEPRGTAVSPAGWFAVTDTLKHRIRWYSESGLCLDEFGTQGPGDEAFNEPSGLALSSDGRLAIADTWNGRIRIMDRSGKIETIADGLFGPRGLLWLGDGSLLVSDTGNKRLMRYRPPDWSHHQVAEFPAPVVGLAEVGGLVAAATPADGVVVLVDTNTGEAVRRLEVPGWRRLEQQEGYLALLPSGRLAATSPDTAELWSLDPAGESPPRLLRGDLPGVTAISLLPDGNLLASLTWEHRLVKIEVRE